MLKYLRIAVTALSLTACVLLIALWVRSYWRSDGVAYSHGKDNIGVESRYGNLLPYFQKFGGSRTKWRFHSRVIDTSFPDFRHAAFSWRNRLPSYFSAAIPHWFPALISAAVGVALWIRWKRRFSIRTLLIATMLVAVGMGLIVLL